jgi:simple sugar transport system permease protein
MRVELVKRPVHSTLFSLLSPFIALLLTVVAGAIMFLVLGKDPLQALYYYFVDPLTGIWDEGNRWQLHELAIKAAPLILIAVGLAVCYQSNNWNIGAGDNSSWVPSSDRCCPCSIPSSEARWCCP